MALLSAYLLALVAANCDIFVGHKRDRRRSIAAIITLIAF